MIRSLILAFSVVSAFIALPVMAADWPNRPVTLYIGYKPGGGTDTVGRVFAKVLGRFIIFEIQFKHSIRSGNEKISVATFNQPF